MRKWRELPILWLCDRCDRLFKIFINYLLVFLAPDSESFGPPQPCSLFYLTALHLFFCNIKHYGISQD